MGIWNILGVIAIIALLLHFFKGRAGCYLVHPFLYLP